MTWRVEAGRNFGIRTRFDPPPPELSNSHLFVKALKSINTRRIRPTTWAPSVTCSFLEKSEVSQIQNKDVDAAASWLTHTTDTTHTRVHTHTRPPICVVLSHTLSSAAIRADESSLCFWVCCSCCVVSGNPLHLLSFHLKWFFCYLHFDTWAGLKRKTLQNLEWRRFIMWPNPFKRLTNI